MKATGSCTICHKPKWNETKSLKSGEQHPVLVTPTGEGINQVCLTCHDDLGSSLKKKSMHAHSAIEKKGCIGCHDPHGSKFSHLTKEKSNFELCLSCHKDVGEAQKNSLHHRIQKMENGCLSCHEAHVAKNNKLLVKEDIAATCLKCHQKSMSIEGRTIGEASGFLMGTSVHAPVKKGECLSCHNVHGSQKDFLLVKEYSVHSYEPFNNLESTELCFKCHKTELALSRQTSTATNFRNGEQNLHYAHLVGQRRQKTCQACHQVHSGPNPNLIRSSFFYKENELPLKFTKEAQGGKCATACHQQMTYNREKAFPNKESHE
jgi:predicted CXXCH cytochrome family protein